MNLNFNFHLMNLKFYFFIFLLLFIWGCERSLNEDVANSEIPLPPYDLSVYSANDGRVVFDWNSNNAEEVLFKIYRSINDTLNFSFLANVNQNYFVDDSLEYDSTYFYYLISVNNSGIESVRSNIISAKPVNYYIPLTPIFVKVYAKNWVGNISIDLSWEKNPESDVSGYNIYKSDNPDFETDSTNFLSFTPEPVFTEIDSLEFYKTYYYKIRAVDKGGYESRASGTAYDMILGIPEIIFPQNGIITKGFPEFKIKTLPFAATYKIVLQENEFFGEVWSSQIHSENTNDTLKINFNYPYLKKNNVYFFRVITLTKADNANSISEKYSFTFKP